MGRSRDVTHYITLHVCPKSQRSNGMDAKQTPHPPDKQNPRPDATSVLKTPPIAPTLPDVPDLRPKICHAAGEKQLATEEQVCATGTKQLNPDFLLAAPFNWADGTASPAAGCARLMTIDQLRDSRQSPCVRLFGHFFHSAVAGKSVATRAVNACVCLRVCARTLVRVRPPCNQSPGKQAGDRGAMSP